MVDPLPFHVVYDYGYDGIMRAFEDNLQRLGLDRIDILLAHDIGTFTHGDENERHFRDLAEGGYRAMDEIRRAGYVKAIGLGVNENAVCMDVLGIGSWDVFLLAGRYTLLEQTPLAELFPACRDAGTSIICGGPFNSGVPSSGARCGIMPRRRPRWSTRSGRSAPSPTNMGSRFRRRPAVSAGERHHYLGHSRGRAMPAR